MIIYRVELGVLPARVHGRNIPDAIKRFLGVKLKDTNTVWEVL